MHKFLKKSSSHLQTPGARRVMWGKNHTEGPQILGTTLHLFVTATWQTEFVHFCISVYLYTGVCTYI
jgi:hypothetical protein